MDHAQKNMRYPGMASVSTTDTGNAKQTIKKSSTVTARSNPWSGQLKDYRKSVHVN